MAGIGAKERRGQDGIRAAGRRSGHAGALRFRCPGNQKVNPLCGRALDRALGRLPQLTGTPILVRFLPELRVVSGRLRSGGSRGQEVHAGSFLRKREIVLETALLSRAGEFVRILLHELFHFIWLHAGNPLRRAYERLLMEEMRRRARGELGWSAELRKTALRPGDASRRTRRWREYACESFCDSGAWLYSGLRRHAEFTLGGRWQAARRAWFLDALAGPAISI